MRVIDQSVEVWEYTPGMLQLIEDAGRTCYKSEPKGDPAYFVKKLIDSGHHSVIEHGVITAMIITNRGVTHELVRHRLASYSQESTRYCNYGSDHVVFIKPHKCDSVVFGEWDSVDGWVGRSSLGCPEATWLKAMLAAEAAYKELLAEGWKPEDARGVLPNDLKTEIVVTANVREWRHIIKLRGSKAAHPQIRQVAHMLLSEFYDRWPTLFQDLMMEQFPHMEKA